jgi:hypothetical protein
VASGFAAVIEDNDRRGGRRPAGGLAAFSEPGFNLNGAVESQRELREHRGHRELPRVREIFRLTREVMSVLPKAKALHQFPAFGFSETSLCEASLESLWTLCSLRLRSLGSSDREVLHGDRPLWITAQFNVLAETEDGRLKTEDG